MSNEQLAEFAEKCLTLGTRDRNEIFIQESIAASLLVIARNSVHPSKTPDLQCEHETSPHNNS